MLVDFGMEMLISECMISLLKNQMDSYEKEQQRLLNIYESLSSDEEVHDPFSDTEGQYGSDEDYDPANEKSDSDDSEDKG
ncbi:hypothetical protein JTB14_019465 [Gonioctena quinquepunctata]|nr:hypothetical protein JTB14_019465 [Gonioctena quinquepunctata]